MTCYQKQLPELNYGLFGHELVVDNFAGAGGASEGIEQALGRTVDLAINHNPLALDVHAANHPGATHAVADVWDINPETATQGLPVGLCWFSPDCRHHSRAKGGRPVSKSVRGLAWVAARWAEKVKPRAIILENVSEFMDWGPLVKGQDGKTRPCPVRKGQTFRAFVQRLKRHGYNVDWRVLMACDFGTPTIRQRFFLIARRDGRPIVWPKPTHGAPDSIAVKSGKLKPWRSAADCIDWSIPTVTIFDRKKPLVDATLRRVANGIARYVVQNNQPYFVTPNNTDLIDRVDPDLPLLSPLQQQLGATQDANATPAMLSAAHRVAAFMEHYAPGKLADMAGEAITLTTDQVPGPLAACMLNMKGSNRQARDITSPLTTICTGSTHAYLTVAFLAPYYGSGSGLTGRDLNDPLPTITTKDRLKLVTVTLDGQTFALVDIGIRMLQPHELGRAQGFPMQYNFSHVDGQKIAKNKQVMLIGNSVPPPLAKAIVQANFAHESQLQMSPIAA